MWKNLNPKLIRQRLIIEATTEKIVEPDQIKEYLTKLSKVSKMEVVKDPITSSAHELGWSGWIHWKTSGAHFYSYPELNGRKPLFTLDTYTCKAFSVEEVVKFTKEYFKPIEIVWKEVKV